MIPFSQIFSMDTDHTKKLGELPLLLTYDQCAALLNISKRSVQMIIAREECAAKKEMRQNRLPRVALVDRRALFHRDDVIRYAREMADSARTKFCR